MSGEDNIGKKIRERLTDHASPVSGKVWEAIQSSLPVPPPVPPPPPVTPLLNTLMKMIYAVTTASIVSAGVLVAPELLPDAATEPVVSNVSADTAPLTGRAASDSLPIVTGISELDSARIADPAAELPAGDTNAQPLTAHSTQPPALPSSDQRQSVNQPVTASPSGERDGATELSADERTTQLPKPERANRKGETDNGVARESAGKQPERKRSMVASGKVGNQSELRQNRINHPKNSAPLIRKDEDSEKEALTVSDRPTAPDRLTQGNKPKESGAERNPHRAVAGKPERSASNAPARKAPELSSGLPPTGEITRGENKLDYSDRQKLISHAERLATPDYLHSSARPMATAPAERAKWSAERAGRELSTQLIVLRSNAQNTPKETAPAPPVTPARRRGLDWQRWSADLLLSPTMALGTGSATSGQPGPGGGFDGGKPGAILVSGGLRINFRLSDHFLLSSGIWLDELQWKNGYSQNRQVTDSTQQFQYGWRWRQTQPGRWDSVYTVVDTVWQHSTHQTKSLTTGTNRASYLGIPLMLTYQGKARRLTYYVGAGVQFNLLRGGQQTISASDTSTHTPPSPEAGFTFRRVVPVIQVNGGLRYALSPHFSLLLEPRIAYSASSVYESSVPLQQRVWIFGLSTGLRFTF